MATPNRFCTTPQNGEFMPFNINFNEAHRIQLVII